MGDEISSSNSTGKKPVKLETWRQLKDTRKKLFYQNENKMKVEEYV